MRFWIALDDDRALYLRRVLEERGGLDDIVAEIIRAQAAATAPDAGTAKDKARAQYGSDDIEFDEDATVAWGDGGHWVQGWLWVAGPEGGEDNGEN